MVAAAATALFGSATAAGTLGMASFGGALVTTTVAANLFTKALITSGLVGIITGIGLAVAQLELFGRKIEEISAAAQKIKDDNSRFKKPEDLSAEIQAANSKRLNDTKKLSNDVFQGILQTICSCQCWCRQAIRYNQS